MYLRFKNLKQTKDSFVNELDEILSFFDKYYLTQTESVPLSTTSDYHVQQSDKIRSICAAVSGGSDSLSLLFLLKHWCSLKNWKLYCCTVDHKLRPESIEEALYVKSICNQLSIDHTILSWNHNKLKQEGKLETLAREARYNLIKEFCKEKNIQFLATGHNWNDQLETYELRKESGSSEFGLAGMSQIKSLSSDIKILRPLLHFSKKHLENFLKEIHIDWKVDPMNFQDYFKRVVIRKRLDKYSNEQILKLSQTVRNYGEERFKTELSAVEFLKSNCAISDLGFAQINKKEFLQQNNKIQIEVLRRLIWNIGMKKYSCSIDTEILSNILTSKINTLGKCFIKIKKDKIYIFREKRNIERSNSKIWDNRFLINLELTKNQYIDSATKKLNDTISLDILVGFPCLYEHKDIKYSFDELVKFVKFIRKPDLLDIYCGVNCEQKL